MKKLVLACSLLLLRCSSDPAAVIDGKLELDACSGSSGVVFVRNQGTSDLTYSVTSSSPTFQVRSDASGTVAPGGHASIEVAAAAGSVAGAVGTLQIETNDAVHPHQSVALSLASQGALLEASVTDADLGDSPVGVASAPFPFVVHNAGPGAAKVSFASTSDFIVSWAGGAAAAELQPNDDRTATVRFVPTALGVRTQQLATLIEGSLCGAKLPSLKGTGVASTIGVSPGDLPWGDVPCGYGPSATKSVSLQNSGSEDASFTATFPKGSIFTVQPSSGVVPAHGTVSGTVTRGAFPQSLTGTDTAPDAFAVDLRIETNAAKDKPHVLPMHLRASGVALSIPQPDFDFGSVLVGTTATKNLTVVNSGTVDAHVTLNMQGPPFGGPTTFTVPFKGSYVWAPSYTGLKNYLGYHSASTVSLYATEPSCGPVAPLDFKAYTIDRAAHVAVEDGGVRACVVGTSGELYCYYDNSANPNVGPLAASALPAGALCVLTKKGAVFCEGAVVTGVPLPMQAIPSWTDIIQLVAGWHHVCALHATGVLSCFGENDMGQLGDGTTTTRTTPGDVPGGWQYVAARDRITCAQSNGQTYCWGDGKNARLGPSALAQSSTPVHIDFYPYNAPLNQVAIAGQHVVATGNGTFWWGDAPWLHSASPVLLSGDYAHVSSGCGVVGGTAYCWGDGTYGQLQGPQMASTPQGILSLAKLKSTAWGATVYGIGNDGRLWQWGYPTPNGGVTPVRGFD